MRNVSAEIGNACTHVSYYVDYAHKAFDSVCREALLYKLWKMGIQRSFFKCSEFTYQNSSTKVKLQNKLSDRIDVVCELSKVTL